MVKRAVVLLLCYAEALIAGRMPAEEQWPEVQKNGFPSINCEEQDKENAKEEHTNSIELTAEHAVCRSVDLSYHVISLFLHWIEGARHVHVVFAHQPTNNITVNPCSVWCLM